MTFLDLPPALDDPVDALFVFHRHIERHLAALGRVRCTIEVGGVDERTAAAAIALLSFFSESVPAHHAREERWLLPLLESRIANREEREGFRELRATLVSEHHEMDAAWRRLSRPLQGLAEGLERSLPDELVRYFRALHAIHIPAEEAELHRLALRLLRSPDRRPLASRIGTRASDPLRGRTRMDERCHATVIALTRK